MDARTRVCVSEFSFPFLFGFLVCGFFFFVSFFVFYFVFRFLFSVFCFLFLFLFLLWTGKITLFKKDETSYALISLQHLQQTHKNY